MPDNINAIIAQGGNPTSPPPDIANIFATVYKIKQMKAEQQSQNAFRQLFADPTNFDPTTREPTDNALAKAARSGLLPDDYQAIIKQKAELAEKRAQVEHLQSETSVARQKLGMDQMKSTLDEYDSAVRSGTAPDIALRGAKEQLHDFIMSQPISDEDKQRQWAHVGQLDGPGLRAAAMTMQQQYELAKEGDAEADRKTAEAERVRHDKAVEAEGGERLNLSQAGKWEVLTDPKSNTQYRYNPETGAATTLDGSAPYSPQGAQKIGSGANPRSAIGMAMQSFQENFARDNDGAKPSPEQITKFAEGYTAAVREGGQIGGRTGSAKFSEAELENAAKLSRDAYTKLPRGQFMPFNELTKAFETQTSSPEQAAAYAADNTVVNTYARMVSPTGVGTESDKTHAREMLNTAQSQEAHQAVIEQLEKEGKAMLAGARAAQAEESDSGVAGSTPARKGGHAIPSDLAAQYAKIPAANREKAKQRLQAAGYDVSGL